MRKNLTDINILLDGSGSMSQLVSDVEGCINQYIKDQQKAPGQALLTVAKFDAPGGFGGWNSNKTDLEGIDYDVAMNAVPISSVKGLPKDWYKARGMTPLLAAMKRMINDTGARLRAMPESKRPEKVIVVIQTDGLENASGGLASREEVAEMIRRQTDEYKWEFVFMGANFDAFGAGASLGFQEDRTYQFAASVSGLACAYGTLSFNTSNLRGGAAASMAFSKEQQDEQDKLGAREGTTTGKRVVVSTQ